MFAREINCALCKKRTCSKIVVPLLEVSERLERFGDGKQMGDELCCAGILKSSFSPEDSSDKTMTTLESEGEDDDSSSLFQEEIDCMFFAYERNRIWHLKQYLKRTQRKLKKARRKAKKITTISKPGNVFKIHSSTTATFPGRLKLMDAIMNAMRSNFPVMLGTLLTVAGSMLLYKEQKNVLFNPYCNTFQRGWQFHWSEPPPI